MHTKTALAASVLAVAAGVPLAVGQAQQDTAPAPITLTEGKVTEAFADTGRKGLSDGDGLVFRGPLLRDGKAAGRFASTCTVIDARRQDFQCTATFVLPDGRISAQALVRGGRATGSVGGGTGAYTGARGTLELQDGRTTTYVLRLVG